MIETLVSGLFAVVALATTYWALSLRRRLREERSTPPPAEPFPPIVHAVAASLDVGLVVIDREQEVRYINPQAEALFKTSRAAIVGQGLMSLIREYQVDALVRDALQDGEAREMVLQPLTGGPTLRLRAAPFDVEEVSGAVLIVRDVTQLNMLERARRDMVANVSHELRTPLASVKLLVETLQTPPPPAIAQRMLIQMAQEVDAITQLVDELHELSQIESGRVALQLSPASIAPMVSRAIERSRPQAERKALSVESDVSELLPLALMDSQRIGQVLLNLLHNAVKFSTQGGTVSVQAWAVAVSEQRGTAYIERRLFFDEEHDEQAERRQRDVPLAQQGRPALALPASVAPGEWLLLTVTDTGIGIPARDLPRIFERFYKVDRARTRNAGGTGLGLAIAKHLIEGHGGRIWATSEEGMGSTFAFVLPLA